MNDDKRSWVDEDVLSNWLSGSLDSTGDEEPPRVDADDESGI